MASKLPSYTQGNLALVGKMTSPIAAGAARYGVPAEAIAGALAQEQFDQKESLTNYARMIGSALFAREFLDRMFIDGRARKTFEALLTPARYNAFTADAAQRAIPGISN